MSTQEIIINARNSERFLEKVYALRSSARASACLELKINTDLCYKNILDLECRKAIEHSLSLAHGNPSMLLHDALEYRLYNLLCRWLYMR